MKKLGFGLYGAILVASCGGAHTQPQDVGDSGMAADGESPQGDSGVARDGGSSGFDGSIVNPADGTPMHMACVTANGTAITGVFGRLDGYLRAVVLPNIGCGGDRDHVKLRVEAGGQIYDFAVNVLSNRSGNVSFLEKDSTLPGMPWTEGWHSAGVTFDYPGNLKVASGDFTAMAEGPLAAKLDATLKSANHVSIYATPYGASGADKVHRNGGGGDGAIVINPTTSNPHFMVFHFSNQTF